MNPRQPVNPYIAGSPITGTEMFYGREDVFSFIRRNLIGLHRDTPLVLVGQRRTGKTSVLYQLHRHLDDLDPSYRCIFIDLHGLNLDGMGNLLLGIANAISRGLRRDHQLAVEVPERAAFLADPLPTFEAVFLDRVWSALGEEDHLVLMMDEVVRLDEEVEAGRLDREIFDYLRHLMQHHPRLNFIFSLGSGLEEMKKDYALLFGVALHQRISFLEPTAARKLITQPARDHYQVAPQAVERILQITSGHPYYTQLVCHCLFDLWSHSPKPVLDVADVDAILPEAIELGSANLTYVWEDSTPGEQALMTGMAAAAQRGPSQVTLDQVRDAWRTVTVSLPDRELAWALRSLTSRDVVAGSQACSFTVDLQRLWLEKHRRLDWVKEELAETVQQWNRSAVIPRRIRYLAIAAVVAVLASYLVATATAHVFPFSSPTPASSPTPGSANLLLQVLPGDLYQNGHECQDTGPPGQWSMSGLVKALHCTDPGFAGGNVYAYQLDSPADLQTAWRSFNEWWGFDASNADETCPPKGNSQGVVRVNLPGITQASLEFITECGMLSLSTSNVPAYAWYRADRNAFVIAEGGAGTSFSALTSWLTRAAPSSSDAVTGKVTWPDGNPAANASVYFNNHETGFSGSGWNKSDYANYWYQQQQLPADGSYSLTGCPCGDLTAYLSCRLARRPQANGGWYCWIIMQDYSGNYSGRKANPGDVINWQALNMNCSPTFYTSDRSTVQQEGILLDPSQNGGDYTVYAGTWQDAERRTRRSGG